ncbi:uncharacterized protein LOC142470161 isoform X2 [Ascaphus truei]|uniref:uncharacterized protein LOC142470161 isoform X2 n=1 Tax=Ascaphus truei TaxID=8439 RepID=UPI003F5A09BF
MAARGGSLLLAGFLITASAAAQTHHVSVGSQISICGLVCPHPGGVLTLDCREGAPVLEIICPGDHNPVIILNITSNSSLLGSDVSLRVIISGEEATVTWKVDGGVLPDRYKLSDRNRTLLIPHAQREDAGRRFSVRAANPVNAQIGEHVLVFEESGSPPHILHKVLGGIFGPLILFGIFAACVLLKKQYRDAVCGRIAAFTHRDNDSQEEDSGDEELATATTEENAGTSVFERDILNTDPLTLNQTRTCGH